MSEAPLCRDFHRGICRRDKCRFAHKPRRADGPYWKRGAASRALSPVQQYCRHFAQTGKCRYGERCKFLHPVSPLLLPDEILLEVLELLNAKELCTLSLVCKRFSELCKLDRRWHVLFTAKYGAPSKLCWRAATVAGSWRELYKSKCLMDRAAAPWNKPTIHEIHALSLQITDAAFDDNTSKPNCTFSGCSYSSFGDPCAPFLPPPASDVLGSPSSTVSSSPGSSPGSVNSSFPKDLVVLYLLDGSGSLSETDFNTMRTFVKTSASCIKDRCPRAKIGVLQFTTEVRVEVAPVDMEVKEMCMSVDRMPRMSGGTNLAAPIRQAETLLRDNVEPDAARAVVLLSDGIVETMHARDAAEKAMQLGIMLPHVSFYGLGVGRDVDVTSMRTIIGEIAPPPLEEEEEPWPVPIQYNGTQSGANRFVPPARSRSSSTASTSSTSSVTAPTSGGSSSRKRKRNDEQDTPSPVLSPAALEKKASSCRYLNLNTLGHRHHYVGR
mmetsp:Transcript_3257/g.3652  ORF Transcript_3257/g.3652 Transcript_3257/m.3652 type:complete len:495 (+) Transcript_3257:168-1652(+)|eukprot:CAMPEP_0197858240 /NCGR_PEP_ID=MMETSP1438-20131217/31898_1 /TAXON_ID=1461541 /ORGANISM="Pterosperma sp., Strain CCMP1384" /LENGTH=494 /DNA_ID=CAMNT_0043474339 /DNA_START=157 /DNA_END=1641 /DNA_ORIENTATION=+